jgi:hypothetical protein
MAKEEEVDIGLDVEEVRLEIGDGQRAQHSEESD